MSRFLQSIKHALNGIKEHWKRGTNFKIQLVFALLALGACFVLKVTRGEWLIVILFIVLVLALETLNSAIELLCDMVSPETHPQIKLIKDMSAAAVLIAAILSIIAGAIIFIPKLLTASTSIL
ncbi:MAG: diacylglycerol kinase [Flavobacteriales bacterium]|jgi:diacylglycerol kinase